MYKRTDRYFASSNAATAAPYQALPVAMVPLAIFSMVVLALEVLLTRMLSYSFHTLLLYTVLGIAMLGFGAAGSLVAIRQEWLKSENIGTALTSSALFCVITIIIGYAGFSRLTPYLHDVSIFAILIAFLLTAPFLAAGTVVTLALSSMEIYPLSVLARSKRFDWPTLS
jgi:hypothetical protein